MIWVRPMWLPLPIYMGRTYGFLFSERLNISPTYLSDMLRSVTGQNTQQHIHNKLIEKAKEQLSATSL